MNMIANQGQFAVADANLLQLGRELDKLLTEWRPIHEEAERLADIWWEQAEREGVAPNVHPNFGKLAYTRFFAIQRETGASAAVELDNAMCERIDAINRSIRAILPTSFSGLGVWAKATRFDWLGGDVYERPEEFDDWDGECLARLLDLIDRLASSEEEPARQTAA